MSELILHLKKDRQIYAFVVLGLILIVFPAQTAGAAPYILGIISLVYAAVNIFISLKYPDAQTRLGDAVTKAAAGAVILFMKENSISVLGIIWAMLSLQKVAEEIDECHKTKAASPVNVISIIISIVLAAMLMIDPFKHFNTHIRILGLEILISAFIRRKRGVSEKPYKSITERVL